MTDTLRYTEQNLRNNLRLAAWAERWRATFGSYPSSYKGCDSAEDVNLIADLSKPPPTRLPPASRRHPTPAFARVEHPAVGH